jgi:hypothetical protein
MKPARVAVHRFGGLAVPAACIVTTLLVPMQAWACGEALAAQSRLLAKDTELSIAFAPSAKPISVGQHFTLDVYVCPEPGNAMPSRLKVSADMPAHRHGMNYKTTVRALGNGRFAVEGLMFHMPGRWRFIFEVTTAKGNQRLTREIDV